jgi:arginyl-tRNA synthetase
MLVKSDEQVASLVNQHRTGELLTHPVDIHDLETIYPQASALAKQDPLFMGQCR